MKSLLASTLLALSASAHAGLCPSELSIGLHTASYHTDTAGGWNNTNPGLYVQYKGYQAGVYHNSVRDTTVYAAKTFYSDSCRFELAVGAATGYKKQQPIKGIPLTPLVTLAVNFDVTESVRAKVLTMPTYRSGGHYGAVLHLMIEKDF